MQALYELPDEKVTPEEVMALADSIEADIQGGPACRPLLAVPHILADVRRHQYHAVCLCLGDAKHSCAMQALSTNCLAFAGGFPKLWRALVQINLCSGTC